MTLILVLSLLGGLHRIVYLPGFADRDECVNAQRFWTAQAVDPDIPALLRVEAYCKRST